MNIKIVDCTFRDGGYYNKLDFEILLVQKYLHAINESNIDIIELGFLEIGYEVQMVNVPNNSIMVDVFNDVVIVEKILSC